jgi:hypothetical protein
MLRRDFLRAVPIAAGVAAEFTAARVSAATSQSVIEPFDYQGVRLGESRWRKQVEGAREYYLALSDDDILHGFRAAAGLAAPGKPLGGWCRENSSSVFGQWLSGLSRLYRATGDVAVRDKAVGLMTEWAKTIGGDGDSRMRHYAFDKLTCGLLDLHLYAGVADSIPLLERVTTHAQKSFEREPRTVTPSHNTEYYGLPQEWYTLSENQYRAYQATGNPMFRDFAEVWLYRQYWNKFADTARPIGAQGVHAYSHVNTFSGAAMAYQVTGDPTYLRIIRNFYQYMQDTQCYATGGYGPNERFMTPDGSLGKALETRSDTFETLCGSWAGFKLSRYLIQFTGEARYGDWIERLFYNGSGAALPLRPGGRNFYYSDYRISGGLKVDYWENFTCCSGTYIQDMADYHNLIYFQEASSLYVNLYVPSEVTWGTVKLTQETSYPETETTMIRIDAAAGPTLGKAFALKLRVPGWCRDMSVAVNGKPTAIACKPGEWATIERTWTAGDRVEVKIPLHLRYEAVDRWHPQRVAIVRGPIVLAVDYNYHDPAFELPRDEAALNRWLVPDDAPSVFRVRRPDGRPVRLKVRPFFEMAEEFPYLMYFDLGSRPFALW